jgi:transcriptional regulator with XRE-family HTH domain
MQSHEVFKQLLKKMSAKQVAGELGLSLSLVYKWAEPPKEGSGAPNPLDRIDQLLKITGDPVFAQWICERAGGFFIKNPETKSHPYELIPATNNIIQEFADLLGVISTSVADGAITPEETQRIRNTWEQLKAVTEGFVRAAEEGKLPPVAAASALGKANNPAKSED